MLASALNMDLVMALVNVLTWAGFVDRIGAWHATPRTGRLEPWLSSVQRRSVLRRHSAPPPATCPDRYLVPQTSSDRYLIGTLYPIMNRMPGTGPDARHIEIFNLGGAGCSPVSMVALLAEEWRSAGYRVSVAKDPIVTGDIGILNIDRTRIDPSELPANPRKRPLLNSSLLDISKRRISRQLVERGDGYRGPVIVKTDLNHSGLPEQCLVQPGRWARLRRRLAEWSGRAICPGHYPIFESPGGVPSWIWRDRSLVVERLLCEREEGLFVLRMWVFLGSGEYTLKFLSRSPVVKYADVVRWEFIDDPVPAALRRTRDELGADFGKFDFVIVDGEPRLFDVNKTPVLADALRRTPEIRRVAMGIRDWS